MRDLRVESLLEEFGVAFTYLDHQDVLPSRVNFKASQETQQRFGRHVPEEKLDAYVEAYRTRKDMPALVVEPAPDGRWVILDGLSRYIASQRAGVTHLDLYQAQVQDDVVRGLIGPAINNGNGVPLSHDEATALALYQHEKNGVPMATLARQFGLNLESFKHAWTIHAARTRVHALGIPTDGLGAMQLKSMGAYGRNTNVLRAYAAFCRTCNPSNDVLNAINRRLGRAGTEAEQLAVLTEATADPELARTIQVGSRSQQRAVAVNSRLLQVRRAMTSLSRNLHGATIVDLGLQNQDDREKFVAAWKALNYDVAALLNGTLKEEGLAHPDYIKVNGTSRRSAVAAG